MLVDVLEFAVLSAFWAFTIWRFVTPQTERGKAVRLVVLLAAVSITFNRREIAFEADQLTGVPDICVPLKGFSTAAASAAMVRIVGLLSPDPARFAWLRRAAYALLAAACAAMTVLFLMVPRSPARGDFVEELAGTPMVTAYGLLTQLGLAVGLASALVMFRPRRAAPGLLRAGMWLLTAAAVVGLLFMTNRVVYQLSNAAGSTALDGEGWRSVSRGLLGLMLLLFAIGGALPAFGGVRRWWTRYTALHRLRPMWLELTRAAPGVVLGDPPGRLADVFTFGSVELRLYRRVIEIRDAQWQVHRPDAAGTPQLPLLTDPGPAGPGGSPAAGPSPDVLDAEVRQLLDLTRRGAVAVATPDTSVGHDDASNHNG